MTSSSAPLSLWRRLWSSLPLAYKLVLLGLGTVMTVTVAVMIVTYASAGESLKIQLERQMSRDLNVLEKWYRARLEELQLTAVGLARHDELPQAIAQGRLTPAAALLAGEEQRLKLDLVLLLDREGRWLNPSGRGQRFDPHGLLTAALTRKEQIVGTEHWTPDEVAGLPVAMRHPGLVRLVVTPLLRDNQVVGALMLGEWVGTASVVPHQVTALIGGAIGLLDLERMVSSSGFPGKFAPGLPREVWADVAQGRYFFAELSVQGEPYMLAFRPIIDHGNRPIGAFVRGFPQSEISEELHRYAGSIFLLTAAAVIFALLALFWLTRRLLFPLRRLARISTSLAAGDPVEVSARGANNDELGSLAKNVATLAERLTQSREELAEAAVKLEAKALSLADRNAQLGALHAEKAGLLEALREHDRVRGQLIEKIITAQEDERKRIARELHDQTGQSLTSLLVGLKYVEGAQDTDEMRRRTAELKALTLATLEEVHSLSVALRPAMLDDLGLPVALRSLIQDFGAQHGIATKIHVEAPADRLPPLWEVTLYRIVQEALTNVAKYAQATTVAVTLEQTGDDVSLAVADDGRGFDPAAVGDDGREHLGLVGMQERVALLGGAFQLKTAPGAGTQITIIARLPEPLPPSDLETPYA